MLRYFLIALSVMLANPTFVVAQQKLTPAEVQKIRTDLHKPMSDSLRARAYLKLASHHAAYPTTYLDSALYFSNLCRKLAQSRGDQRTLAFSDACDSEVYRKKGDLNKAREMLIRAKERDEKYNLTRDLIDIYIRIGKDWYNDFKDRDYLELALQLTIAKGYRREQQHVLKFMADRDAQLQNYQQAIEKRLQALELSKTSGDPFLANDYSDLGNDYGTIGNYEEAVKYGLESIRLSEGAHDTTFTMANRYNALAKTYHAMRQFEKALVYFAKAVNIARHHPKDLSLSMMITNYSACLLQLKRYDQALEYLNTMVARYPPIDDEDRKFIDMAYMAVYLATKNYREGEPYYFRMVKYYEAEPHVMAIYLIRYCIGVGKYQEAQQYLDKANVSFRKMNSVTHLTIAHKLQFELDSIKGDYVKAIRAYQRYKTVADSTLNEQQLRQISELEVRYETQKKDKDIQLLKQKAQLQQMLNDRQDRDLKLREQDIDLLNSDRQLQEALTARKDQDLDLLRQKQRLQEAAADKKEQDIMLLTNEARLRESQLQTITLIRNVTIAGAILLAILIALLYNRYQIKQRSNREINEKNRALRQLVTEKEWLVKEVHHRVKNNLQTVVSLLQSQAQYLKNDALHAILDSQNRVHAMSLIHQKLYQREGETSVNLQVYLHELVNHLKYSLVPNNNIYFSVDVESIDVDASQAVPVGLIVNEAVTNSIKYAFRNTTGKHNQISLSVKESDNRKIALVIADNGEGLPADIQAGKESHGLGLMLIHGLAQDIGGEVALESHHGLAIRISFVAELSLHSSKKA